MTLRKNSKFAKRRHLALSALWLACSLSHQAHASSNEPAGINLGGTSFVDRADSICRRM